MPEKKLSPAQLDRIQKIQEYLTTVARAKKLVVELEAARARPPAVIQTISSKIAREFSQLRQRALTDNIGTVADVAGALATMAARSPGMQLKIRGLNEGIASLNIQLEQALKAVRDVEVRLSAATHAPLPHVEAERRSRGDRRTGTDRRQVDISVDVERRSGGDRRSGIDRRHPPRPKPEARPQEAKPEAPPADPEPTSQ